MLRLMRTAAALAVVGPLALTMSSAQAASDTHADGTGDVWITDVTAGTTVPSSESLNIDLTQIVVTHKLATIRAVATYVDLQRTGEPFAFNLRMRNPREREHDVTITTAGRWSGAAILMRGDSGVQCEDLTHKIDYAANTVAVKVPRACVRRPSAITYRATATRDVDDSTWLRDDARTNEVVADWSSPLTRG